VTDRHHVVIVGAGFAGLTAAKRLARATSELPLRVTLVDKRNHHTFQPLLYQVATAGLQPQSVGRSLRSALRGSGVDVRLGELTGVDRDAKELRFADGSPLAYDELILAIGSTTADHGIDGVADHTFPLKWLSEATALRDHLLALFEQVDATPDRAPDGAMTFVVVGGGPTGVELAGAIAELIDHVIARDHPRLDPSAARILLVEMLDDVLPPYSAASRRYTRAELERRGIEVRTGTAIEQVGPDHVRFDDGEQLATRTVIWTAGVQGNPVMDAMGIERGQGGRVPVRRDLRLLDDDAVYVVGDVAGARDADDDLLPQLAPVATQQGRHAAEQILARLHGEPTQPFRYRDKGTMATIGRRAAVAELPFGLRLRGTIGWVAWLVLHLVTLIGFRNRAVVLFDWAISYLRYDRAARIILAPPRPIEPVADPTESTDDVATEDTVSGARAVSGTS
jgi:NADH:ubiquinone reductase (H+-translocating)